MNIWEVLNLVGYLIGLLIAGSAFGVALFFGLIYPIIQSFNSF